MMSPKVTAYAKIEVVRGADVVQLPRVHVYGQMQPARGRKKPFGLRRREGDRFAEGIDRIGETARRDVLEPGPADRVEVAVAVATKLLGKRMQAKVGGLHRHRQIAGQCACHLEQPALRFQIQAVAGFDLEGGDPLRHQAPHPRHRHREQRFARGGAAGAHRRLDATAGARDVLVRGAAEPLLELGHAIAAVYQARRSASALLPSQAMRPSLTAMAASCIAP